MSGVNETRFLVRYQSCKFMRVNESVCKLKEKWNHDQCCKG